MAKLRHALTALLNKEAISGHMPGHKGNALHAVDWFSLDTTEIDGTDNLHAPTGILKTAMANCASVYGAAWSHFLVNGSTVGVLAAMLGTLKPGEKVIIGRDCHKSVYSALALGQLDEIVVMPQVSRYGEMLGYPPEAVLSALAQHPEVRVVVLTSPTYFGYCTALDEIAKALEARGGILIVDEAHGAHLNFSSAKSWSALQQGAHIVIQSAHKTLPAMTQTGLIHFAYSCPEAIRTRVLEHLSMLQSTSPSYVLMCSIDEAISWMVDHGAQRLDALEAYLATAKASLFKNWLPNRAVAQLPGTALLDTRTERLSAAVHQQDPFKLWLTTEAMGYDGYTVHNWLTEQGINPELTNHQGVLIYLSAFNTIEEIERIGQHLNGLPKRTPMTGTAGQCHWCDMPRPNRLLSLQAVAEAMDAGACERVPMAMAAGRISAKRLVPYPPGVPLLMPGELIEQSHIDYLLSLAPQHVVLGLEEDRSALWCVIAPRDVKEHLKSEKQ